MHTLLRSAHTQGQRCIIMSHSPLDAVLSNVGKRELLCWNWAEVRLPSVLVLTSQ